MTLIIDPSTLIASGLGRAPHEQHASIIAIDSKAINQGAMGRVYRVISIDRLPVNNYMVKLFPQELPPNLVPILRVTSNCRTHDLRRIRALEAFPLYAFQTAGPAQPEFGYLMRSAPGQGFDSILEGGIDEYLDLPLAARLTLARQFCEAADALFAMTIQHGDLNPPNVFVDMHRLSLSILDVDGGGVAQDGSAPVVFGKCLSGWVAPEVYSNLAHRHPLKLQITADLWNVAVMVHCLVFGVTPFFFLARETDIPVYLGLTRWPSQPNVSGMHLINPTAVRFHHSELEKVPKLYRMFHSAFQSGYHRPELRPTPYQWLLAIDAQLADLLPHRPKQKIRPDAVLPLPASSCQRLVQALPACRSASPPTTQPPQTSDAPVRSSAFDSMMIDLMKKIRSRHFRTV